MKENYKKILELCNDPDELLKFHYILCGAFIDSGFCESRRCDDCPVHLCYVENKKKLDMKLDPKTGLYL